MSAISAPLDGPDPAAFGRTDDYHYRCSRWWDRAMLAQRKGVPLLPRVLITLIRAVFGAELPMWERRPDGLMLMHNAQGVVIHPRTMFKGGPVIVFHQTTFGNTWNSKGSDGSPKVGRYILIGVGAKILGDITVGDFCIIGANCVLTKDLPDGHIATGNPATIRPLDRSAMLSTVFGIDGDPDLATDAKVI
jgi:serine O-acetyltransferase